jgi:hypothetical protein
MCRVMKYYVTLRYVPVFHIQTTYCKQSKCYIHVPIYMLLIYICYVILRYVPVLPHTDYIMQTVESTIYYVQYVPVLSHTDYILKNSRKGYTYMPLYRMSEKRCDMYLFTYRIHNTKQPRWPYICICLNHTECNKNVALCTCPTYRLYNAKQPRWLYICICINHTECFNGKIFALCTCLHTDYIIKNSQKKLHTCTEYMKIALCNPAICTCTKCILQNAEPETKEK